MNESGAFREAATRSFPSPASLRSAKSFLANRPIFTLDYENNGGRENAGMILNYFPPEALFLASDPLVVSRRP